MPLELTTLLCLHRTIETFSKQVAAKVELLEITQMYLFE